VLVRGFELVDFLTLDASLVARLATPRSSDAKLRGPGRRRARSSPDRGNLGRLGALWAPVVAPRPPALSDAPGVLISAA
jgi:hypothetical protein